jgi:hypothetical protein
MRRPYCKERIRNDAVRCKHCHSSIGTGNSENSNTEDLRYLQNGFSKINQECDAIEGNVKAVTGFVFVKHQYSEDELGESVERIESFVEKMRDDLDRWDAENKLPQRTRLVFDQKAQAVYERLERINRLIQEREPTLWEKICAVFQRIFEKLLPMFSVRFVSGVKSKKMIAGF